MFIAHAVRPPSIGLLLALCAAGVLTLTGCSSDRPSAGAGRVIDVVLSDFHVQSPRTVRSGDVTLRILNKGPDAHEIIIVRLGPGKLLPRRLDGMSLDEDALEPDTVAALEPGAPGSVRTVRVHLAPGRYELFCNMSGHFMGGMARRMMVTR